MKSHHKVILALIAIPTIFLAMNLVDDLALNDCGLEEEQARDAAKKYLQEKGWPTKYLEYKSSRGSCLHLYAYESKAQNVDIAVITTLLKQTRVMLKEKPDSH